MSEQEQVSEDRSEETNVSEEQAQETNAAVDEINEDDLPSLEDYKALEERTKNQDEAAERLAKQKEELQLEAEKYKAILKSHGVENPEEEASFVAVNPKETEDGTKLELSYRPQNSPKLKPSGKVASTPATPTAPKEIKSLFEKGRMGNKLVT